MCPRHRADGVARDETRVRERDPRPVRQRELELAGRVLGMELHHAGPLGLERPDQVAREGLVVGEDGCAVPGPLVRRDRIRLVGLRRASSSTRGRTRARRRRAAPAPRPSAGPTSCARTTGRTAATCCPPGPAGRPPPSPSPANPTGRPPTRDRGSGACRPPAHRYRGPRSGCRSPGTPRRRWTGPRRTGRPPRSAARGSTFTRVTPSGPTTASATCSTPAAPSRRATVAAVGAAAGLGRVGGALRVLAEGLRTTPGTPCAPSRSRDRRAGRARSAASSCTP